MSQDEKAEQTAKNSEKLRIVTLLTEGRDKLVDKYTRLISHSNALLKNSMIYAYNRGYSDALNLVIKGDKNEKTVQEKAD